MRGRPLRILITAGIAVLVLLVTGHAAVRVYTDILWFGETGYLSTYWTRLGLAAAVRTLAALVGATLIFLNLWWVIRHLGPVRVRRKYANIEIAEQVPRRYIMAISVVVAVLGGWWLAELQFDAGAVVETAAWARRSAWGLTDPFFGHDVAFYVFTLPLLSRVVSFLILVGVWTSVMVGLGHVLAGGIGLEGNRVTAARPARIHLAVLGAALLILLGLRYWLQRYGLVVEGTGVGGTLGFADARARMPAYWILLGLSVAAAASLVHGAWRGTLFTPVVGVGALLLGGALAAAGYPALVQRFQVEPNELSREARFIRWNLEFTRRAYALDRMSRVTLPYTRGGRPAAERLDPILERLPLWDPEPLERAFNETQSLFLYYWFPDVDLDRYGPPGAEQQVAVAVREFQPEGLEAGSQTWQSLRLNPSYIRGQGAVVAAARPAPDDREPDLLVRNLNPVVTDPRAPDDLTLAEPSVFFGEAMEDYAIVVPGRDSAFLGNPGVEFPRGIRLSSFLRVLAFAWRFGDEALLFSGDVTRDSRVLFRRAVRERVETIAPFLVWDSDPLPVIHRGRIVWLLDGYTVSGSFPLARATVVGGRRRIRYLRNPVKAAVDAVTGEVAFYRVGPPDPLLATYERVFPGLVRPFDAMPPDLQRHLRYPDLALRIQAEILREYHLERAEAFYAGQDVWERPRDPQAGGAIRPYRPVYALMPSPLGEGVEFVAALPFIARGRQNMTAMLLAGNDPGRYGALDLYEFPRDQQVPGPGQFAAMLEQDPVIAPDLTLLRQRGSGVDMGHIRIVPVDSAVLYVQPLFLSADENAIPELIRVVVSDGRDIVMAESLPAALARLALPVTVPDEPLAPRSAVGRGWADGALELLEGAEERLRSGDWAGYGRIMDELRAYLETVSRQSSAGGD